MRERLWLRGPGLVDDLGVQVLATSVAHLSFCRLQHSRITLDLATGAKAAKLFFQGLEGLQMGRYALSRAGVQPFQFQWQKGRPSGPSCPGRSSSPLYLLGLAAHTSPCSAAWPLWKSHLQESRSHHAAISSGLRH